MSNLFIYYVYAYLRFDGTPYYIGKGKNKRAFLQHNHTPVPEDKSRIIFLETNLSDIGALALERRYIRWYGRKDNNTGILRNMTDGGDGAAGAVLLENHKRKISEGNKGKIRTKKARQKIGEYNKIRFFSKETRQKMSDAKKNKPISEEHKRKISQKNKGRILDSWSLERRKKKSEDCKGKILSKETCQKMGDAKRGIAKSEEHKRKLRDCNIERWRLKKLCKLNELNIK